MRTVGAALVSWVLALAGAASAARSEPSPAPAVTAPAGATLGDLFHCLERSLPGVVVADSSAVPATLGAALKEEPLERALARISVDFDRCWLRRGSVLALQRRYADPDEDPGLEIEELRQAADDLYGLIRPFYAGPLDIRYTLAQNEFAASLTPEQQHLLAHGGLPLAALPRAQREAWLAVNNAKAFAADAHDFRRLALCLSQFSRLSARDSSPAGFRLHSIALGYADPLGPGGRGALGIPVPRINLRARSRVPEGQTLNAVATRWPPALRTAWEIPAAELELQTLAQKLAADGGPTLEYPAYAAHRKFWVYSRGAPRGEVLAALGLLWGWELAPHGERFFLGRPHPRPAQGPVDLEIRLLAGLPPATRHMLDGMKEGALDRVARQMDLVLRDAERKIGPDWKQVELSQLSPESRQRLANVGAMMAWNRWYSSPFRGKEVPAWITHPERGVLHLSGPITPTTHPMLTFEAADDNGQR
ncbi:MAG TPA: hypothetical protein VFU47_17885, partial [Armatimonadota bacterium]|nr:hypothetical protein [Armatimonadota bacterium]